AGAAAERRVVHRAMAILGEPPDVDRLQRPRPFLQCLAGQAFSQRAREHLREERQRPSLPHRPRHTLLHASFVSPPGNRPAGGSTTTLPPSMSISGTASSVKGNITPPDTSITDPAPKSWKAITF